MDNQGERMPDAGLLKKQQIPNLIGMTLKDADQKLRAIQLKLGVCEAQQACKPYTGENPGKKVKQHHENSQPGQTVDVGSVVNVYVDP